ncbi:MAG: urate hydroxylase PuuD, partial [Bacteroidia bacterium]
MELTSLQLCFLVIFLFLFITAVVLNRSSKSLNKKFANDVSDKMSETKTEIRQYKNVFFFFSFLVVFIYIAYFFTAKYNLGSHVMEWLNLVIRWAHVVFGIAWIGASFYFIFLENSLNRTENLRDELAGNLWAIHGGGFYYVEKYKSAPPVLPKHLHWFKYEAYFTWLTGMLLLTLVYFMNAKAVMIDSSVREISSLTAILIGSGTMFFGWFIYDWMCNTSLLQKKKLFALIGFLIVVAISF